MSSVIEDHERCLELWRIAGIGEVFLPAMPRPDALQLRRRLYRIRAAMGRQQHSYYPKIARAKISLILIDTGVGGDELWTLSIEREHAWVERNNFATRSRRLLRCMSRLVADFVAKVLEGVLEWHCSDHHSNPIPCIAEIRKAIPEIADARVRNSIRTRRIARYAAY